MVLCRELQDKGLWSVSNDLGWWTLREMEDKRWLCQSGTNDLAYAQPMLIAGDGLWGDYRVQTLFRPESKDRNSEMSCLTAMTLEGKRLWQIGTPDPWKDRLTNDVAFQIHDLDLLWQAGQCFSNNQQLTTTNFPHFLWKIGPVEAILLANG